MTDAELDRLDRLAAEKVMGWELDAGIHRYYSGSTQTIYCSVDLPWGDSGFWWKPTRNIEQAWKVLEKIGNECRLRWYGTKSSYEFDVLDDTNIMHEAVAETPALAITLACLKSRGISVSPDDEEGK